MKKKDLIEKIEEAIEFINGCYDDDDSIANFELREDSGDIYYEDDFFLCVKM